MRIVVVVALLWAIGGFSISSDAVGANSEASGEPKAYERAPQHAKIESSSFYLRMSDATELAVPVAERRHHGIIERPGRQVGRAAILIR